MNTNLKSSLWRSASEDIRKCHLSTLNPGSMTVKEWQCAFLELIAAISDERRTNPDFAKELPDLTAETGFIYDFKDILEEYFDHLEENKAWNVTIDSTDILMATFSWVKMMPSEYMYRKGNALQKSGKIEEAKSFGEKWLKEYPQDLYAAASNVFLNVALGNLDYAEELTEKYLSNDLVCNDKTETIFMAAEMLYEKTEDSYAKERVAKKIAEYEAMISK